MRVFNLAMIPLTPVGVGPSKQECVTAVLLSLPWKDFTKAVL